MRFILLLFTLNFLVSCVGTVQDTGIEESNIASDFEGTFFGVEFGKAVSHNKVQLYFKPATGASTEFSYLVYVDGNFNNSIASLAAADVKVNSQGYATVLASGLSTAGKTYSFTIRAVALDTGAQDKNTKVVTVATLSDIHPDFNGILKVENVAGAAGEQQLSVSWNKALPGAEGGGGFGQNPYSIGGYVIYYATSEENVFTGNISTINDPNQTKFTLTGLNPNTTYFVAIRAKDIQTPVRIEKNEVILSGKTRSNQPIVFAGLKSVTVPTNIFGYNQFIANWEHGTGSFDRYKIFFTTDLISPINPKTHPIGQTVTITDLAATPRAEVYVPTPNTKYRVAMAACKDSVCSEHAGQDIILEVTTSPPVSSFTGIETLAPGEGPSLVDTIQLSWPTPDTTTGAYDGIRIYQVDGANKTLLPVSGGAYVFTGPSGTGATVRGLVEGDTYCFMAKAYVNDPNYPATASYAGGREDTNSNVKCLTLQYQQPVFLGINNTCTNNTTSTFKVSWNPAVGYFDNYELFYKNGSSSQFIWNEAISGNPAYTKVTLSTSQSSYFLPGLSPGQTYTVGIKTRFNHPNGVDVYRSNSNVTISCTTSENRLKSSGWLNIMALGPKSDGISGNRVFESIAEVGTKIGAGAYDTTTPFPTVVESTEIRPAIATAQGVNASSRGIVHLTWSDFNYENGARFCGTNCDALGPNDGYYVYRMAYNHNSHNSSAPQRTDIGWVLLNNNKPVKPKIVSGKTIQYQATFTDYQFDVKPENEAKVYWYKVEPVIAGALAPMISQSDNTAIFEDFVIKVILPSDNMGFVHRWMANLQNCTKLGLEVDRKNQYRCQYNGLGAVTYSVNGTPTNFYDFGGHTLVDRYELSCNFSRGYEAEKKCPTGANFVENECIYVGTTPANSHIASTIVNIEKPIAMALATGAVMYNSKGVVGSGSGTGLKTTATMTANDLTGAQEQTSCNYFDGTRWIALHDRAEKLIIDSGLTSIAKSVSSNKAGMPPLSTMTQAQLQSICNGYDVKINLSTTVSSHL